MLYGVYRICRCNNFWGICTPQICGQTLGTFDKVYCVSQFRNVFDDLEQQYICHCSVLHYKMYMVVFVDFCCYFCPLFRFVESLHFILIVGQLLVRFGP